MLAFPNAKINLGLNIVEKRPEGYHNLETIFYPIPIEDILEVTPLHPKREGNQEVEKSQLHLSGATIIGKVDENLVVKAYKQLDKLFNLPPIVIHLFKKIPMEAGLGGGSSDAAFMLKLLNKLFHLEMNKEELLRQASLLGADCAFFIFNSPCYAEGIGNLLSPISLSLSNYRLWVVKPNISISTKEAYTQIRPHRPSRSLKEIVKLPIGEWKKWMVNDFEEGLFPHYPLLKEIKDEMYHQGAVYASMSGSGSAIYGLFRADTPIPTVDFGKDTFVSISTLPPLPQAACTSRATH